MTDIVPYGNAVNAAARPTGMVESWRLRGDERRANAAVVRRSHQTYVEEVSAQLDHGRALRDQQRLAERTDVGLELAGGVFDKLVDCAAGDEAKARFLLPIALQGRDAIVQKIR